MAKKKTNIVTVGKHKYYLDGYLKSNLNNIRKIVKQDWDFVFLIDGMEGGGKSTFTIQLALYLDPTLNMSRIVFDAVEFEKEILKAEKYQAIIYDEAITGLYSREAMQYINTSLTKLLAQIRQKNLFIFVLMPTFFDMDKYVAMWRSRGLFHIYTKNFQRGYFVFYDHETKKDLYAVAKKYYNYHMRKPTFKGRFTSFNPFDKEYRAKKLKAIMDRADMQINPMFQRDKLIQVMYYELGLSQVDICKYAGLGHSTIQFVCSKGRKLFGERKTTPHHLSIRSNLK
ncbi:hypothetical protein LCGC14_0651030 [marine sediment metagenome]|uniref:Zona occludens toxin N-terminal domain-containing protein n=1 Tax=marine sediment metagenome TaxID=412755 RepID=A0A0F9R1H0_9ZZZZ